MRQPSLDWVAAVIHSRWGDTIKIHLFAWRPLAQVGALQVLATSFTGTRFEMTTNMVYSIDLLSFGSLGSDSWRICIGYGRVILYDGRHWVGWYCFLQKGVRRKLHACILVLTRPFDQMANDGRLELFVVVFGPLRRLVGASLV